MLKDNLPDWIKQQIDRHFDELSRLFEEQNYIQDLRKNLNAITEKLKNDLTPEQYRLVLEWEEAVNYQHAVEKEWLYLKGMQEGMKFFKDLHIFISGS